MPRPDATAELIASLGKRILMLDGAMGTTIRGYGLTESDARGSRFENAEKDLLNNGDILSLTRPDVIESIRNDEPIADERLEALRGFATAVIEQRGWVSDAQVEAFLAAGYEQRRVFDVILGAAMKTLSNYTNHVAETPLDAAFEGQRWVARASDAA